MRIQPKNLFVSSLVVFAAGGLLSIPITAFAAACNFTNTNIRINWAPSSPYDMSGGTGSYSYSPGSTIYRSYGDLGLNPGTSRNWTTSVDVTNNGVTQTLAITDCTFASINNPCYRQTGTQTIGGASFNFHFEVQSYVHARLECTPSSSPDLIGYVGGAASVVVNQAITLYGSVLNGGDGAAAGSNGMIEICDANCATVHDYRSTSLSSLAPGASGTVSGSYTPAAVKQLYYRVCADWNGSVAESNEGNNCSGWQTLTVLAPPTATLTLSPNSVAYGGSSTVSWSSTNATTCTGANFSTGGATSGSVTVSATQSTTYTVYCSGPGGNASDAKTLTVGAQPFPDLISYVGSTVITIAGQTGSYSGSTSNIGNAAAGAFNDLFIFYNANQVDWNGYVRATRSGAIAAGSSAARSASYAFATPGTYYYRLCADWDGEVGESSEGNNCSAYATAFV